MPEPVQCVWQAVTAIPVIQACKGGQFTVIDRQTSVIVYHLPGDEFVDGEGMSVSILYVQQSIQEAILGLDF